jgi:transcriptional regulator with XRE-family HTH domain
MSFFSENIRVLRAQKELSQQKVADDLLITRARFSKYEEGKSEPPFDVLKRISTYYHISIDILISVDLRRNTIDTLLKLSDNRILLPITVDRKGTDFIEIIPHKAKAGYLLGYCDPEFIEELQQIQLPFLTKGKYRAFPIEGDSMPPLGDGSFVVGRYVENYNDIKNGKTYVILSHSEGIVYKRLYKDAKNERTFSLVSDNHVYEPYDMQVSEILEIWEFACSLSTIDHAPEDLNYMSVSKMFQQIRVDLAEIKSGN